MLIIISDNWSVSFFPYSKPGEDPVFAVAGSRYITVARPAGKSNPDAVEVIRVFKDEDDDEDFYYCTWTKNLATGAPLVCAAGKGAKIKIFDVKEGRIVQELTGHGGDINWLAICPTNPQIIASTSDDYTIRVWSLDPSHKPQPCAAILAGGGHKDKILTLAWHETGRYILSAGIERIINLWTLPELPDENTGTDHPTRIHYPHFSTSEVHDDIVDCVSFYHDLIISKAAKDPIVLWAINGFSSNSPPPPPASEPTTHDTQRSTRSAFTPSSSSYIPATANAFSPTMPPHTHFTRLIQFHNPESDLFYTRFGLFQPPTPEGHTILAMCSNSSKMMFWDLARLEEYFEYSNLPSQLQQTSRPEFLMPVRSRNRQGKQTSAIKPHLSVPTHIIRESSTQTESTNSTNMEAQDTADTGRLNEVDTMKTKDLWDSKYSMADPSRELLPHREEVAKGLEFVGRQVAWSRGGEWCVVAGSASFVAVFSRWKS
ncbi:hypothetical protein BP5796_02246 [Coleophoma crateriformis]|uniref:Uncharacterized protein n=1 Tax=Coleophoma crateriformis TaxID=565419 RepID=A0A3D8SY30_9HELO|nr:hypothetical protein BP5796_02246 [Coleophoma crateriformis]